MIIGGRLMKKSTRTKYIRYRNPREAALARSSRVVTALSSLQIAQDTDPIRSDTTLDGDVFRIYC